ncbi:DUF1801 domain-containing protein [Puteibacter caeruleilacunae]|nr:DUF1801 domain-containing protein [Puteibacter caeruleilacunae]
MAELKTKPTDESVEQFIEKTQDPIKKEDCLALLEIMKEITGCPPVMWGESIVGFGAYHYKYASGREGDWFQIGFSPRKQNISLYLMGCIEGHDEVIGKLGKVKTGKSCIYFKGLSDISIPVLRSLLENTVRKLQEEEKK